MEILIVPIFAIIMAWIQPSPTAERLTLLPDAHGHAGAVIVTSAQGQQTLNTAYATLDVKENGQLKAGQGNPEAIQQRYGELLALQPKGAMSFTLYFTNGSDNLTDDSRHLFKQIQTSLADYPAPQIAVIGHTDRVGKLEDNDQLSLQRAEKVRALLIESGIDASLIEAQGRGEREPAIATEDDVAEPQNRRAEVSIR